MKKDHKRIKDILVYPFEGGKEGQKKRGGKRLHGPSLAGEKRFRVKKKTRS